MSNVPNKNEIHIWAAAGAATAASLPIGLDAKALSTQEVIMIIRIGTLFGVRIDKSAALGILSASIATAIGQAAAFTAFEAANVGYPATIPIKAGIAAGLIEAVGHAAFAYFNEQYNK